MIHCFSHLIVMVTVTTSTGRRTFVSKRHYLNSCLVSIEKFDLWWIHICFYLWLTFHLDGFHIRFTSVSTSVAARRLILGSYWLIAIYNNNNFHSFHSAFYLPHCTFRSSAFYQRTAKCQLNVPINLIRGRWFQLLNSGMLCCVWFSQEMN